MSLSHLNYRNVSIVLAGFVIVFFWISTWGLVDEFVSWAEEKLHVKRVQVYGAILVATLILIFTFPAHLEKL
jgi:hypothetical protein